MVYHDHATQRLSQQFGIYCIVATGCLGLYSCVNPSNSILNSSNFLTSLMKHLNATIRINFSFLLDWLKPPNTKMKRMIRDFRITNVLRHDFGVFLLIKYWCSPDASNPHKFACLQQQRRVASWWKKNFGINEMLKVIDLHNQSEPVITLVFIPTDGNFSPFKVKIDKLVP